jgi:tetratricopeptide (TPR) repeat protein
MGMLRRKTDSRPIFRRLEVAIIRPDEPARSQDTMTGNPALQQQLENAKAKHGETAPQVVPVLQQMGAEYQRAGDYEEAERCYKEAISILEKHSTFAQERCLLFRMHHALGLMHRTRDKFAEAEPHYLHALKLAQEQFGKNHPEPMSLQNYLAGLYCAWERYDESERLLKDSLNFYKNNYGKDHEVTAVAYYSLALVTRRSSYASSKEQVAPLIGGTCKSYYDKAAKIANINITKLEVQTPHQLFLALMRLSYDRFAESRFEEAEELFRHSLLMELKEIWPHHPLVSDGYQMLGDLYKSFGTPTQAEYLYKQALAIREEVNHPKRAATAMALGTLLAEQRKYEEAEAYLRQACELYRKDEFPPRLASALKAYAEVLQAQNKRAEADSAMKEATEIYEHYGQRS